MPARDELETIISGAHDLILEYQSRQMFITDPKEKMRARHEIESAWKIIEADLPEYARACMALGVPMSETMRQLWAMRFPEQPIPTPDPGETSTEKPERELGTRGDGQTKTDPPLQPIQQRWALLVGINQFIDPAHPLLQYCVNDTQEMQAALENLGYSVVSLYDNAPQARLIPTKNNVEAELERLCQVAQANDLLWVHFSTHGLRLPDGTPVLVMRDTRQAKLDKQALPVAQVETAMKGSKARRLVLTLDACHIGTGQGRAIIDEHFVRTVYEMAEGFDLIAASHSAQVAQEDSSSKRGLFTHHLLHGLNGEADYSDTGIITSQNLANYTLSEINKWCIANGLPLQQPQTRREGQGEIILADHRTDRS